MNIYFENEEVVTKDLLAKMNQSVSYALELEKLPDEICEISVTFVEPDEIKELNRDYRDVDSVTDVLSFPQYEVDDLIFYAQNPDELPDVLELGDVVICKSRAEEQAVEFGHSFERELIYLFTHSILHLLGYDHMEEDEKACMRKREEEIMDHLGIPRR